MLLEASRVGESQLGELLRREGLHEAQLTAWRAEVETALGDGATRGKRVASAATKRVHEYPVGNSVRGASAVGGDGGKKRVAIVICQINKDGAVAGPEMLQHWCDILMMMQGSSEHRTVGVSKNGSGGGATPARRTSAAARRRRRRTR